MKKFFIVLGSIFLALIVLGAIGIAYGALVAIVQKDLKRLAAYSTLSHLSFITLGIFTFTISGLDGGMYQILNHGIRCLAYPHTVI